MGQDKISYFSSNKNSFAIVIDNFTCIKFSKTGPLSEYWHITINDDPSFIKTVKSLHKLVSASEFQKKTKDVPEKYLNTIAQVLFARNLSSVFEK